MNASLSLLKFVDVSFSFYVMSSVKFIHSIYIYVYMVLDFEIVSFIKQNTD